MIFRPSLDTYKKKGRAREAVERAKKKVIVTALRLYKKNLGKMTINGRITERTLQKC